MDVVNDIAREVKQVSNIVRECRGVKREISDSAPYDGRCGYRDNNPTPSQAKRLKGLDDKLKVYGLTSDCI